MLIIVRQHVMSVVVINKLNLHVYRSRSGLIIVSVWLIWYDTGK